MNDTKTKSLVQLRSIIKKLQTKKEYNPFSDSFDYDKWRTFLISIKDSKLLETNDKDAALSIVLIIPYLNSVYTEYYDFMKNFFTKSTLSNIQFQEFELALCSRLHALSNNKYIEKSKSEIYPSDALRMTIPSIDATIGKTPLIASLEMRYDLAQTKLNYLRYIRESRKPSNIISTEVDEIDNLINLNLTTNVYEILKTEYEEVIWNNGAINFKTQNEIIFTFPELELKIKHVGKFRAGRIINQFAFPITKSITSISTKDIFLKRYPKNKLKRIKSVDYSSGEIKIKLAKGIDRDEILRDIFPHCEMIAFYSFIKDFELPNSDGLTIIDCLDIISLVKHIMIKSLNEVDQDDSVKEYCEFNKFPYKITKTDLIKYLENRSNLEYRQLNYVINLLSHDLEGTNRINIYATPLLKMKSIYLIASLPLISPVVSYQIDKLLTNAGVDLDMRGVLFENYVQKKLELALKEYKYSYFSPETSDFKTKDNGSEEIDLVIELKDIILIAELKCITYPFEPRDFHNAKKRLIKASEQINRKKDFLLDNQKELKKTLPGLGNKEIISAIVTQFTFFTGMHFNGIPVIDFSGLLSYFSGGTYKSYRVEMNGAKMTKSTLDKEVRYYTDESTFNSNLDSFLKSPYPVKKVLDDVTITIDKITPKGMTKDFYVTNALVADKTS